MLNRTFPDWSGRTAVILASGHSLTSNDVMSACVAVSARTIAVNSTATSYPDAGDVTYGGDFMWWKKHRDQLPAHASARDLWTCDRSAAERYGLSYVKGVNRLGLGKDDIIHTNGNSGAQAINLAYLFGARRILLLGFDMKLGPNGEKHHHPDHPKECVQSQTFEEWIRKLGIMATELHAAGCEVVNCTRDTALHCFRKSTIEKELP